MSRRAVRATIDRAPVLDDLPLSPELVLVSPPDVAARARAVLTDPVPPPPAVRADRGLSRGEIAAVYAVSLAVTAVPLALTLLTIPSRS
jgi:hypothetical protein